MVVVVVDRGGLGARRMQCLGVSGLTANVDATGSRIVVFGVVVLLLGGVA